MTREQLKARLYRLAIKGLKSARHSNPFWTTREATAAIVGAFELIRA